MGKLTTSTISLAALAVIALATPTPAAGTTQGDGSMYCYLHIPTCSVVDSDAWFGDCRGDYPEGEILSWFAQAICNEWHAN
jgi:hypothetical protein